MDSNEEKYEEDPEQEVEGERRQSAETIVTIPEDAECHGDDVTGLPILVQNKIY